MSSVTIQPSLIYGEMQAPASKSCMQRACAAALLKGGITIVHNYGISSDDKAAIDIIKQLGADFLFENNKLIIDAGNSQFQISNSKLHYSPLTINCNESGLSLRMFTPIVALLNYQVNIVGSGSLLSRPIDFFDETLPQLNVAVKTNDGKLPLTVNGPLIARDITIDGAISSQFLTGLLFAFSAKNCDAVIRVNNLKSKPYIDLTLQVMKEFQLNVPVNRNYQEFIFTNQLSIQSTSQQINYIVEGDWSNAAFLLVAGAIAGSLVVKGLNLNSTQGDKAILKVLKLAGCDITIETDEIKVANDKALSPFDFDATDCPDLFPPLVALASYCNGISNIKGVNRLQHKESNRAISLQSEFAKMGVQIMLNNDTMVIEGNGNVVGAIVESHNDHRIAMACAVAALQASGNSKILNADAVNKSYPNFYDNLKRVGAMIE